MEVAKYNPGCHPSGWDGLECTGHWSWRLSTVVQSTHLVSEGLAWPVMGCVPASRSLNLVFCVLRLGSLQSLFSKFLVGPWCPPLFIIHLWEVEEGRRCRERSSFLEKVGGRGFKEEVAFALYPERRVGVQ